MVEFLFMAGLKNMHMASLGLYTLQLQYEFCIGINMDRQTETTETCMYIQNWTQKGYKQGDAKSEVL